MLATLTEKLVLERMKDSWDLVRQDVLDIIAGSSALIEQLVASPDTEEVIAAVFQSMRDGDSTVKKLALQAVTKMLSCAVSGPLAKKLAKHVRIHKLQILTLAMQQDAETAVKAL